MLSCLTLQFLLSLSVPTLRKLVTMLLITLLSVTMGDVPINIAVLRITMLLVRPSAHRMLSLYDLECTKHDTFSQKL